MKILLVNLTKMIGDSGGMAKITCEFANEMSLRGHDVSIIYSDVKTGSFYYNIETNIKTYDIRFLHGKRIKFPLIFKLKREFYRLFNDRKARTVMIDYNKHYLADGMKELLHEIQPDIIVSFNPGSSALLLTNMRVRVPVITMSHGNVEPYFRVYPYDSVEAIRLSSVNQVLLPSYKKQLKRYMPDINVVVIGNPVTQYDFTADLETEKDAYKIISVGRLTKSVKRQHLLIKAFAKLAKQFPNWTLELWGAKDREAYYKELELLISSYHLENRVFIKGTTNDVGYVLQKSDIFAFPSAYEGFGLALAEGMSAGLPVVGYKNCTGVNELIKDGVTGFLCDDGVESLSLALEKLMRDKNLRTIIGQNAKRQMAQYAPKAIWDKWEDLLEECYIRYKKEIV